MRLSQLDLEIKLYTNKNTDFSRDITDQIDTEIVYWDKTNANRGQNEVCLTRVIARRRQSSDLSITKNEHCDNHTGVDTRPILPGRAYFTRIKGSGRNSRPDAM